MNANITVNIVENRSLPMYMVHHLSYPDATDERQAISSYSKNTAAPERPTSRVPG